MRRVNIVFVPSSQYRSTSPTVVIDITGIEDTRRMLGEYAFALLDEKREFLVRAADAMRSEVRESIMGNRGEPKSVDTGNFANSISVKPTANDTVAIYTDVEYAQFLEYGTSRMMPRAHFQNTAFRMQPFIQDMAKAMVRSVKPNSKGGVQISIS